MAPKPGKSGERSAASATRFTATTPHASSMRAPAAPARKAPETKSSPSPSPGAAAARKETSRVVAAAASAAEPKGAIPTMSSPGAAKESPQQRVARLRAAHEAAKTSRTSPFDRFLERTRPILNSAHKVTVMGLVGLTVVAGVMTAYTALDMMSHNRKRQAEFVEAQRKMAADSLEAARLAYMRGEANDEQVAMVEEAQARAQGGAFQMPSLLSAPTPIKIDEKTTAEKEGIASSEEGKSSKLLNMLPFWGSKKETEADPKEQKPPLTLGEKRTMLEQARAAFEEEKEKQRKGGPLDRLGNVETTSTQSKETEQQPKKKGWLW